MRKFMMLNRVMANHKQPVLERADAEEVKKERMKLRAAILARPRRAQYLKAVADGLVSELCIEYRQFVRRANDKALYLLTREGMVRVDHHISAEQFQAQVKEELLRKEQENAAEQAKSQEGTGEKSASEEIGVQGSDEVRTGDLAEAQAPGAGNVDGAVR